MRAIDADAFKDYIREACEDLAPLFNDNGKAARLVTENFCKDIDEQPTIQPKRGKWIIKDDTERFVAQCNCCRYIEDSRRIKNFCPNCGADMREKGENSESN